LLALRPKDRFETPCRFSGAKAILLAEGGFLGDALVQKRRISDTPRDDNRVTGLPTIATRKPGEHVHVADFIEANIELIMHDRATFARRLDVTDHWYIETALRDSAREILTEFVVDMRAPQRASGQSARSKGEGPQ